MGIRNATRILQFTVLTLISLFITGRSAAQTADQSPQQLVRETVKHELAGGTAHSRFMYTDHKVAAQGSRTERMIETNQGTASLLVAVDDKPASVQQRQEDEHRLAEMKENSSELKKKEKNDKEGQEHENRIIRALPDAFLFDLDGTEPGRDGVGKPGDELVRLIFHPDPKYVPPSRVEEVLTAMQGVLVIDKTQHRIARIDGTLFKEVAFGWGILGHLDKGGHFLVEQADEGNGAWEVTHQKLQFTGKILMLKRLDIKSDEVFSEFHPVSPNLTFAQGVDLLEKEPAQMAQDRTDKGLHK
ncbi:MAG TPA: hypothetical protein VF753_16010 [Terriglobales bacterium]